MTTTEVIDQSVEDARIGALIRSLRGYGTTDIVTGTAYVKVTVYGLDADQYDERDADDVLAAFRVVATPNGTHYATVTRLDSDLHAALVDTVQFLFAHTPGARLRPVTA